MVSKLYCNNHVTKALVTNMIAKKTFSSVNDMAVDTGHQE